MRYLLTIILLSWFVLKSQSTDIKFSYLDVVAPNCEFFPAMYHNTFHASSEKDCQEQHVITANGSYQIAGYEGKRCIIEQELGLALKKAQEELSQIGPYKLKIFDAYRPQSAVDFFGQWIKEAECPTVKQYFHPRVNKSDFHNYSYIARKSSHSLGTAVDLTIKVIDLQASDFSSDKRPSGFLGYFNRDELDMGNVGYLAFDLKSSHHRCGELTSKQAKNRSLLTDLMIKNGFEILRSEFWHYFFKRDRNRENYFNFAIQDDYMVSEEGTILFR
ncbi:M15 family metallopeptidase [Candidatus Odyssella acanthamoebae]|uniref:M15 family metallopeptidase n=1 Tax=Candidatus Odyssella acanthamoebae TaxID=91604 RepID=UPI00068F86CE|nr:M15 family metallopeptidase [Candidatus Paracaedibacter acanthamoebae]